MADEETTRTARTRTTVEPHATEAQVSRRISWGAVFAGGLVAVAVQLLLTLLGLAIGFGVVNPAQEAGAGLSGLGTGTAWWWLITSLVSLFVGGWVAGRLSGVRPRIEGALHGLTTWSLATVLTVLLAGTAVGNVVGGLLGAVGEGAQALQEAIGAPPGERPAEAREEEGEEVDRAVDQVVQEAREILRETEAPALQPEQIEERGEEASQEVEEHLRAALTDPQQAERELRQMVDAVWSEAREVGSAADREALVNALVAETDLSQEEARRTVDRWEQTLQEARQEAEQMSEQLADNVQEQAGEAADALAWASLWTFIALLAGALSAMGGGVVGAPRR